MNYKGSPKREARGSESKKGDVRAVSKVGELSINMEKEATSQGMQVASRYLEKARK